MPVRSCFPAFSILLTFQQPDFHKTRGMNNLNSITSLEQAPTWDLQGIKHPFFGECQDLLQSLSLREEKVSILSLKDG